MSDSLIRLDRISSDHTTDLPQCQPEGSLSDVAEEVIAIPLKTNGHCSLNKD